MNKPEQNSCQYWKNQAINSIKGGVVDKRSLKFILENPNYERVPCFSFSEFVRSKKYLGIGEDVYEVIKKEGDILWKGILEGKYTEGVCLWGIGSGKSFLSSIISLLFLQRLLCLREPHKEFGLANDKPLAVVNMGTTATQAKNVVFAGIKKMIEEGAYFQQFDPEILQTEIRFKKKNITLYCGNSQETMPIGMNVICSVLDEAAWYLDNENKSVAENIYNTIKNRITSRFGDKGFIFIISAPRYIDDFITRKFKQAQEVNYIYATGYKTWEVKDSDKMSTETFNFNVTEDEIWKVPKDFEKVAQASPEKFMRDFGARPSFVLEAFDRDSEVIDREVNENREEPIIKGATISEWSKGKGFKDWFKGDNRIRNIHIDLALKKDSCGLTMACLGDDVDTKEGRFASVYVDLMLKIDAPPDGEISFEEVRQVIYRLQERGFSIGKVTYDGWQSTDSIQILKGKGIKAEILSVDRTLEPYDTLKSLLHSSRLDYYRYEPLTKEYKRLELIKGKKVDHPLGGSKDVSDSLAGVVASLTSGEQKGFYQYLNKVYQESSGAKMPDRPESNAAGFKERYKNQLRDAL